jgi:hypothetical protein
VRLGPGSVVAVVRRTNWRGSGIRAPVVDGLTALGLVPRVVDDGSDEALAADAIFCSGSVNWFPDTWARLRGRHGGRRPPVLFWHTEPLPLPDAAPNRLARRHLRELVKVALRDRRATDPITNARMLEDLRRAGLPDVLVVSTYERKVFLAEQGVDVPFVPLGYHESHGRDLGLERDLDVLFLGAPVPRRKSIVRSLRRRGVDVIEAGRWHDPRYWGEARTQLLNRTKVLLNIPRHPGFLSGLRMVLGMANKALVVAEPIFDPRPYVPGTHFVSASLDEMPAAIESALADDAARLRMTEEAHRFVTEELRIEQSLAAILEAARAQCAA